MPRPYRIALWQTPSLAPAGEDAAAVARRNLDRALAAIAQAAARGAHLFCTPELFLSRYFCQSEDHAHFALAEAIPGPTTTALAAAARRAGIAVVASLFERRAPGIFHNTAVVFDPAGRLLGRYRKMHIPDDPRYYEKFYFTPGDLGFQSFALPASAAAADPAEPAALAARVGALVCWDQWFPEAARLTALRGAEILFFPTAIGWHPSEKAEFGGPQRRAWETMLRAHAIANGVFVAVPNRVGFEPAPASGDQHLGDGIEFWGSSLVIAPDGEILARAGDQDETLLFADCDLHAVERARTHWPFLRDRRVDAYAGLAQRWLAAEEG